MVYLAFEVFQCAKLDVDVLLPFMMRGRLNSPGKLVTLAESVKALSFNDIFVLGLEPLRLDQMFCSNLVYTLGLNSR